MKVLITKRFAKDVSKELNNDQKIEIAVIIDEIQSYLKLSDIANL
jgi:hypothetical protein